MYFKIMNLNVILLLLTFYYGNAKPQHLGLNDTPLPATSDELYANEIFKPLKIVKRGVSICSMIQVVKPRCPFSNPYQGPKKPPRKRPLLPGIINKIIGLPTGGLLPPRFPPYRQPRPPWHPLLPSLPSIKPFPSLLPIYPQQTPSQQGLIPQISPIKPIRPLPPIYPQQTPPQQVSIPQIPPMKPLPPFQPMYPQQTPPQQGLIPQISSIKPIRPIPPIYPQPTPSQQGLIPQISPIKPLPPFQPVHPLEKPPLGVFTPPYPQVPPIKPILPLPSIYPSQSNYPPPRLISQVTSNHQLDLPSGYPIRGKPSQNKFSLEELSSLELKPETQRLPGYPRYPHPPGGVPTPNSQPENGESSNESGGSASKPECVLLCPNKKNVTTTNVEIEKVSEYEEELWLGRKETPKKEK